jgi:hypothetical protein
MTERGKVDSSALPGDSSERLDFALNLKEGLDPQAVISDWGDFNNDYPDQAHDQANGISQNQDEAGVQFPSSEEVQVYYDSLQPEEITILQGDEAADDETSDQQSDD